MATITDFDAWLDEADPEGYEEVHALYRAIVDCDEFGLYQCKSSQDETKWFVKAGGAGDTLLAPVLLVVFPLPSEGGLIPSGSDFVLLLALSLGCTLLPFALSLVALRQMSAFSVQMAVNLEPVYSIVLAIVIFHEQRELNLGFYGGVAILLTAVFAQPWLKRFA